MMSNLVKVTLFLFLIPIIIAEINLINKSIMIKDKRGPKGVFLDKSTTCEDFTRNASFNLNQVLDEEWFVFYYWSSPRPSKSFLFRLVKERDRTYLDYWVENHVADNFNWSVRMLLMEDQSTLKSNLLVEESNGVFRLYQLISTLPMGEMMPKFEVRLKQIGDYKYVAVMDCLENSAFLMSRMKEVPPKEKLESEAAKLGYRGIRGKSYLVEDRDKIVVGHGYQIKEIERGYFVDGNITKLLDMIGH